MNLYINRLFIKKFGDLIKIVVADIWGMIITIINYL